MDGRRWRPEPRSYYDSSANKLNMNEGDPVKVSTKYQYHEIAQIEGNSSAIANRHEGLKERHYDGKEVINRRHEGLFQDNPTRQAVSQTQNLALVEKKYKSLLEEELPQILENLLRHPIIYTEAVNSAFVMINYYLDRRIKQLIIDLGLTLGIPDQKHVLLHIVITYPNFLSKPSKDDYTEMVYLLKDCFNSISLKRRSSLTKTNHKIQKQKVIYLIT